MHVNYLIRPVISRHMSTSIVTMYFFIIYIFLHKVDIMFSNIIKKLLGHYLIQKYIKNLK